MRKRIAVAGIILFCLILGACTTPIDFSYDYTELGANVMHYENGDFDIITEDYVGRFNSDGNFIEYMGESRNLENLTTYFFETQFETQVEQELDTVFGAGVWFYYDADRILTEDDFAFLETGMSLEEIVFVVGRQNGISGMNNLSPFYTLENGRLTLTFYPMFSSSFEYLLAANIQYSDGRRSLLFD